MRSTAPTINAVGFAVEVDAEALELVLAFLDREELQEEIDESLNGETRTAVKFLSYKLHRFAEDCPAFDNRE